MTAKRFLIGLSMFALAAGLLVIGISWSEFNYACHNRDVLTCEGYTPPELRTAVIIATVGLLPLALALYFVVRGARVPAMLAFASALVTYWLWLDVWREGISKLI